MWKRFKRAMSSFFGFFVSSIEDPEMILEQNIRDLNLEAWLNPTKWITVGVQYHILHLDSAKDALYNSGGVPILGTNLAGPAKAVNGEATGVGDELVFLARVAKMA